MLRKPSNPSSSPILLSSTSDLSENSDHMNYGMGLCTYVLADSVMLL